MNFIALYRLGPDVKQITFHADDWFEAADVFWKLVPGSASLMMVAEDSKGNEFMRTIDSFIADWGI